jgi:predicted RNA-binding Zn-ribbon protein involved in translation (DUF1610 family)
MGETLKNELVPKCPNCGNNGLWRDSADVGVGTIYGPYGCPNCGWSEDSKYDRTRGTNDATQEGERWVDQWGVAHSRERLQEDFDRWGLGSLVDELFEKKTPSI